ncbi:Phospho-N-acetylmuramoyl-pentapeptide-transferase [uncultured archaeon]|nr:Phospho-N-acetylmuramoyl-pentapeptide-transferase [uncultured archaeon]
MVSILWISVVVSFLVSYVGLLFWIKKCKQIGLLWEDMNKFDKPKNVAASGGIVVVIAFALGVLSYIAIRTFVIKQVDSIEVSIFAMLSVILLLGIVGLVDDFLGWHRGGLSAKVRLILALVASIPLVVINAGSSTISIPFFGPVNFGLIYPLLLIPIGIAATSTIFNFLAGFNGLESGQGVLVLAALSYVAFVTSSAWLALIGLCMLAAVAGFWLLNRTPAKVFPGDVFTYAIGSMIAIMAILGNFQKIALIIFIPYIIEMILKVRGGMHPPRKQSFGIPQRDGSLELPYKKIYGLTHFSIWFLKKFKKKVYENDVVYLIHLIQIIFILLAFLML